MLQKKKKKHRIKKMELELGLKITRTKEDVSSSTDFKVSRDALGQVSLSRETDSVFILTLHLKGFKKKGIDLDINEEGDRITISGRKKVEEMVLVKWVEWKKETEVQEFKKVFKIPKIVNLDKIKARFNEEEKDTLTVTFPKRFKGMTGLKIEEETEPEAEKTEEIAEPEEDKTEEIAEEPEEEIIEDTEPEEEAEEPKMEEEEEEIVEEEEEEKRDHEEENEEKESEPKKKKRKKFRFQCVAGSTLLMSIIVFIIQLIQSKRK